MGHNKILITDKVHPLLIKGLESENCVVTYDTAMDNTRLDGVIHQFDGIIINSKIILILPVTTLKAPLQPVSNL